MIVLQLARERLESKARELGFELFGIASAQKPPHYSELRDWIDRGYAGEMNYFANRRDAYSHPNYVLEGCKSVVMLGMPYRPHPRTIPRKRDQKDSLSSQARQNSGAIASYSVGSADYHDLIRDKLNELITFLEAMLPGKHRGVVDTAPLMERDFAQLAGLGWIGKNTLLLNQEHGSYFFLAALLTSVDLPIDNPFELDRCGSCTACLDACPTDAFVAPRQLDATRCISYWTIEYRGLIPEERRAGMQDWIFGCDECQIVCPWNRRVASRSINETRDASLEPIDVAEKSDCGFWITLSESEFRQRFRGTPYWRTRLWGMQRNALIVAANTLRYDLVSSITLLLSSERDEVRTTAQWALERLKSSN